VVSIDEHVHSQSKTFAFNVGEVEIAVAKPLRVRQGTILVKRDPQE
jgi:hypothetical protein